MRRKRLLVSVMSLALVASGLSVTAPTSASVGSSTSSADSTRSFSSHTPAECKALKKKVAKARKKKNANPTKRNIRRFKKLRALWRKHCKNAAGPSCPAYQPGELGAEAETVLVTDKATEEEPIDVIATFTDPPNPDPLGQTPKEDVYVNVQVDPAAAETGIYARFEFGDQEDMDLWVYDADGNEVASVGGYNPAPDSGLGDGTGNGGHSEVGAEVLDGMRTADCGGWTFDMRNFQNAPGDKHLKLWLGDWTYDPYADN